MTSQWYDSLKKSPLNPPPIVFQIVWPILYTLLILSAWMYKEWTLHVVLMVLNAVWVLAFFQLECVGASLVLIVINWLFLVYMIAVIRRTSPRAAGLLVPNLIWITFATYLNAYVWVKN